MSATREEVEQLVRKIERYLATVEIFRAEGREPVWRGDVALCEEQAL